MSTAARNQTSAAGDAGPSRMPTGEAQRTYLAGERTLLAWVRTSLALMGFGFLVARFGLFLREVVELRLSHTAEEGLESPSTTWSLWIGVAMVVLGVLVNGFAISEHFRLLREFRAATPVKLRRYMPLAFVLVVLSIVGVVLAVYLVLVGG